MGNCANKPLTNEEEAPAPVSEEKTTTVATTVEEREIEGIHKEDDGKKPEAAEGAAKPAEVKPTEPPKFDEVAKAVIAEAKKDETPKPAAAAAYEPNKEEIKPTVAPTVTPTAIPATIDKKVEEKKPVATK